MDLIYPEAWDDRNRVAEDEENVVCVAQHGRYLEMGLKFVDKMKLNIYKVAYSSSEPDWFGVSRNFKNGTEHFPEWRLFRTRMEDIRNGLEAQRVFLT